MLPYESGSSALLRGGRALSSTNGSSSLGDDYISMDECNQDTYLALAATLGGVILLLLVWFKHYTKQLVGDHLMKTSDSWKIQYQ